jgi:hypothetical protein
MWKVLLRINSRNINKWGSIICYFVYLELRVALSLAYWKFTKRGSTFRLVRTALRTPYNSQHLMNRSNPACSTYYPIRNQHVWSWKFAVSYWIALWNDAWFQIVIRVWRAYFISSLVTRRTAPLLGPNRAIAVARQVFAGNLTRASCLLMSAGTFSSTLTEVFRAFPQL